MQWRWLAVPLAVLAVVAIGPAEAGSRSKAATRCNPSALQFSWSGFWFNPRPQPNGCAPAVHQYGYYIGQDPDPRIRQQLRQDPTTGYAYELGQ